MRDIRFRAWDKYNKRMIYDVEMEYDGIDLEYFGSCLAGDRYEPMQYVEIKDKNGKEIYEGDIVREIQTMKETLFEIRYIPKKLAFCYVEHISEKYKDTKIKRIKTWEFEPSSCIEVVGNIYENEELLNEEVK